MIASAFGNNRFTFICTIAMFLCFCNTNAQERATLLKMGGFIYFDDDGYNGVSLHAEYEFSLGRTYSFSSGPRLEYIALETARPSFTIGYELKYYPLAKHLNRKIHGPVLGLDVLYRIGNTARPESRYGPGIGFIAGYQHRFDNRIALCLEVSPIYIQDLNKKSTQTNPEERYWYGFACIKVGLIL